jgi:formyl-CoA transferase
VGAEHATIAPYGPYASSAGDIIMLAVQSQEEWREFCRLVMNDPDLASVAEFAINSARCDHREKLNALISERIGRLGTDEAIGLLDAARIANGRVNTVNEFLEHPALESRGRWVTVDSPGGEIRALKPPASLGGIEPRMEAVPALGAQTEAILSSLGYSPEAIAGLRSAGTI